MRAADVARELKGARRLESGGYVACCPAHDDARPSLSVSDVDGKVLVNCHAGCGQQSVLDALEARGLPITTPRNANEPPETHATFGRPAALWDYHDADGRHVGRVFRFDTPKGKEIRQARFTGSEWVWKAMPDPRPLYGLRNALRRSDAAVLITEGEKACDAAQRLFPGHVAVTWAGGAKAVNKADWTPLANRSVILWPDADVPGGQAMATVAAILRSHDCTVSVVDLTAFEGVTDGWDAADCTAEQAQRIRLVPLTTPTDSAIVAPARDAWSEAPIDFLRQASAQPFEASDVPAQLARYATEWAAAAGVDPSGAIVACVGAAASVISDGLRLEVNASSEYFESARLWVALIGGPGQAKSPSIGAATGPIKQMHREAIEHWQRACAEERDRAERANEDPTMPPSPSLYTSDTTTEALAELLATNERGLLYLSDEFESWIGSHDAYRSGGGKDRGEWLRAYDGGPHQVNRVKRGQFFVPNWGVSIITATTPSVLQKLARRLPADGLLQRFIPVLMRPGGTARRSADVSRLSGAYYNTLARLYEHGPGTGVRVVRLDPEAAELMHVERDRLRQLAQAVEVFGDGFAGHVAKHGGMLARVALVFHCIACGDTHPADARVSPHTVELALRFMRKAFQHARALYGDVMGYEGAGALARAIAAVLLADRHLEVTRRGLTHSCHAWRKAEDERLRDHAMQFLADMGWVREERGDYTKPHPTRWAVNPAIHERFAEYGDRHRERRALVLEALRGPNQ